MNRERMRRIQYQTIRNELLRMSAILRALEKCPGVDTAVTEQYGAEFWAPQLDRHSLMIAAAAARKLYYWEK